MPPFSAPVPDEEPQEAPKGRMPYSSPTAEPETEPRRRPRRIVNRPDKLVAGGPPRPPAEADTPGPDQPAPDEGAPHDAATPAAEAREGEAREAEAQEAAAREAAAPEAGAREAAAPEAGAREVSAQEPKTPARRDPRTLPYRLVVPADESAGEPGRGEGWSEHSDPAEQRPAAQQSDAAQQPAIAQERAEAGEADETGTGREDEPEVRRVGRPPAGRPTRPDLLVATGPPRPQGSSGRHHRGPAPAAVRRSSPVRRGNRAVPVVLTLAAAVLLATGVLVWQWTGEEAPSLRLEAGTGRSGDELFTVPASGDGTIQRLNDMTSVGRAVVAVGSDTTSPTPRPLFLFSPDGGKNWQLGQVNGASTTTVQRVVGGNGRWLASGGDGQSGERGLWTSTDGYSWQAVEAAGLAAFRAGDQIHDIARTASGFVAVGRATGDDGATGPAVWRSGDGRTWERVDTAGLEVREFKAVVARGDTVVAIGHPADGEGSRVVRSADGGRTWQATGFQLPEAVPNTGTLAVLPKRFVLVPTRHRTVTGDVRVYCSPNGAEWSQCGAIGDLSGESVGVESLISYAGGVAAITQVSLGRYSVLTTTDGRGWAKRADLGNLPGATLRGFTISDGGTLFAGGDQAVTDVDNQLVLMSATPRGQASRVPLGDVEGLTRIARDTTGITSFAGRYVAVGAASGDAGLWTIKNWQSWKSMSLGGPGRQRLEDVAHGARGWLAVGGTETNTSITDPLLVTSKDGESWKKVDVSGDLTRRPDRPYLGTHVVAAGKKGYVLAGEDRDQAGAVNAAMWFTSDLRRYTRSKKLPQGGSGVRVHDAVATADGFVAVGGSGTADQESSVVWYSEDGVNWSARTRVAPPDTTSAGLRQITAYQDKLVAIGTALTGSSRRAFAAVSEDEGSTWQTAWLPADQAAAVHDLAAAEEGLVAVGWHGVPGEGDSAAWTSQDGLSWNRMALTKDRLAGQGMQWLTAVAVSGAEVVALGRSTTYDADHLILWSSSLTSSR
ncbi:hypothetical protein ETD86_49220 [Nonomuraea turkmeniaca]|uniref:DUF6242 domain-containing protein n=1 Tax=Nonomuraea turkmeniaca TaxID=103838 RepID=A0A5S4EX39_9ACTN|nr:hypothetical protein [Nonomuraea turkmeniaca]TMR08112.1 hypothetical protein ETD86_49220 [Nonomuraea turkmeniaca]